MKLLHLLLVFIDLTVLTGCHSNDGFEFAYKRGGVGVSHFFDNIFYAVV